MSTIKKKSILGSNMGSNLNLSRFLSSSSPSPSDLDVSALDFSAVLGGGARKKNKMDIYTNNLPELISLTSSSEAPSISMTAFSRSFMVLSSLVSSKI